jgi:hypothetical protein
MMFSSKQTETSNFSSSIFSSTSTYVVSSSANAVEVASSGTGPQMKSSMPQMTTQIFTEAAQADLTLEPLVKKTNKLMKKRALLHQSRPKLANSKTLNAQAEINQTAMTKNSSSLSRANTSKARAIQRRLKLSHKLRQLHTSTARLA